MDVVFAEPIRSFIEEYEIALMKYPISKDRALQKKQEMIDFFYKKLPSVGRYTLRTCPYKRLGQILRNGQPQLPYLLMGSYQDKSSRTTWLFSCIMDEDTDTLTICHILHSNGVYECKTANRISITESDIRNMVRESVYRILDESPNGRIGEYECKNGFLRTLKAPSLKQFGYFNDVRLYYSPSHTYCLLRREDNGTLFFAEIIDAPEIGKNDTKFVPRKPSEVPNVILRDAQSLLRKAKSQHTLLS